MRILFAIIFGCAFSLAAHTSASAEKAKVNQSQTLSNSTQKKLDDTTKGTIDKIGRRAPSQTTGVGNPRPSSSKAK